MRSTAETNRLDLCFILRFLFFKSAIPGWRGGLGPPTRKKKWVWPTIKWFVDLRPEYRSDPKSDYIMRKPQSRPFAAWLDLLWSTKIRKSRRETIFAKKKKWNNNCTKKAAKKVYERGDSHDFSFSHIKVGLFIRLIYRSQIKKPFWVGGRFFFCIFLPRHLGKALLIKKKKFTQQGVCLNKS